MEVKIGKETYNAPLTVVVEADRLFKPNSKAWGEFIRGGTRARRRHDAGQGLVNAPERDLSEEQFESNVSMSDPGN